MKAKVEGLEREMKVVKNRLDRFDERLEKMSLNMMNSNIWLKGVETRMEMLKTNLREVR